MTRYGNLSFLSEILADFFNKLLRLMKGKLKGTAARFSASVYSVVEGSIEDQCECVFGSRWVHRRSVCMCVW